MKTDPPGKGWFAIDGIQAGQRTLAKQVKGLEFLRERAEGKTVLDLGCAEGLVARWFCDAGAALADGLDSSRSRISVGRRVMSNRLRLHNADLNNLHCLPVLPAHHHIVLMLAILQKLRRPETLLDFAAERARRWIAVRTPASVIDDARSGHRKLAVTDALWRRGFGIVQETDGFPDDPTYMNPRGESWLGIFERR